MGAYERDNTKVVGLQQLAALEALIGANALKPVAAGTKTVAAAATPGALAESRSCKAVWVGAPIDDTGAAVNSKVARLGISGAGNQVMPLSPTNETGFYIACDDPSTLFVKVGADGESVNYIVFDSVS